MSFLLPLLSPLQKHGLGASQPNVLLLSTYAFGEPRHGGQVRLANIAQAYERAGFSVSSLAVCETRYRGFGKDDLLFSDQAPHNLFKGRSVLFSTDFLSGLYAANPKGAWPHISARFADQKIDVIHVEQPWLWPLALRLRELPTCANTILVYGSQNIEAPLRREILQSYRHEAEDFIEAIDQLERAACQGADLSLAVTQEDASLLREFGAREVILAPNGIAPWSASKNLISQWQKKLPAAPWALYIASAHPPNFTSFLECMGQALGGIPPNSKLVVAGSVCEHLEILLAQSRWSNLNLARTLYLGQLTNDDLTAVKSLASVFCLPIAHGGGSNIKTAEALYSGASVVGSVAAFRGFEEFTALAQVYVAHSPEEFQYLLRTLLTQEPIAVDEPGHALRKRLKWTACLAPICTAVMGLLESK